MNLWFRQRTTHVMSNGFITGQVIPVDGGVMLRK